MAELVHYILSYISTECKCGLFCGLDIMHNLCVLCLGLILKMEQYTSYIGCETSKVPLSDIAQRIMTALQSVPVAEVQTSRKNNQSK